MAHGVINVFVFWETMLVLSGSLAAGSLPVGAAACGVNLSAMVVRL